MDKIWHQKKKATMGCDLYGMVSSGQGPIIQGSLLEMRAPAGLRFRSRTTAERKQKSNSGGQGLTGFGNNFRQRPRYLIQGTVGSGSWK